MTNRRGPTDRATRSSSAPVPASLATDQIARRASAASVADHRQRITIVRYESVTCACGNHLPEAAPRAAMPYRPRCRWCAGTVSAADLHCWRSDRRWATAHARSLADEHHVVGADAIGVRRRRPRCSGCASPKYSGMTGSARRSDPVVKAAVMWLGCRHCRSGIIPRLRRTRPSSAFDASCLVGLRDNGLVLCTPSPPFRNLHSQHAIGIVAPG
jgi:hypothetical protein